MKIWCVDKFEYVVAYFQPYSVEEDQKAVDDQRLLNISKLMVKLWMQFKIQSLEPDMSLWTRLIRYRKAKYFL